MVACSEAWSWLSPGRATPGRLPFDQSRRPIPLVRGISYFQNAGNAITHELQVLLNRPMKYGFTLNAGYTWLKKLTDLNFFGPGAGFDRQRFRSTPSYVTPHHQLILTYVWDIPVGHKRHFLSKLPRIADGIIGGWRIVGLTKFETGQYSTPYYSGVDPSGTTPGIGSQLPDRVGNGNLPRSQRSPFTGQPIFDTSAFVCPGGSVINGQPNLLTQGCPLSTPQNVGRWGNSSPNILEMPGLNTWNLRISKEFLLPREGASVEVATQITNPWNHPNWAPVSTNLSSPASVGQITATRNMWLDPFSLGRRRIGLEMKIKF